MCCISLKTGQVTGLHPLSCNEFKISLLTTGVISIFFQAFFILPIIFFLSLRILHKTVIFMMLQYLSSGKSHLALPRAQVHFSTSVQSLAKCLSCPANDTATSVTAVLREGATNANDFSLCCNHAQIPKYGISSPWKD